MLPARRSDALTELDRTVKLGLVQVSVSPGPFMGRAFCQELDVADGCLTFSGTGIRIWMCVDPQTDQIVIRGESETEVTVTADYLTWRDRPVSFQGESAYKTGIQELADVVIQDGEGILFYHKNGKNIIEETARVQEVDEVIALLPNFLIDRIFGGYTAAPEKPTYEINPDERSWCVEHLWQNVRHPYHTFLAQGEENALKVLFRYYRNFWEINRFRAKKYYQAEGQHNTEMTLSFGLQSIGIYGADRTGKPTGYADFFNDEVVVYAKDLYRYVETRFTKRENGKLVMGPLNSIETYWDTTNPLPVTAGLLSTCGRLLQARDLQDAERQYFRDYQERIPPLSVGKEDGEDYIQPAEFFEDERHNIEIPELYACFPFGLYHEQKDPDGLMKKTFLKRLEQFGGNQCYRIGCTPDYPSYSGWQYFGIAAARLGMTDLARDILVNNVQLKNPGTRFPAMWGPIYDGVPDTDHGANIIHQLQEMVMQVREGKIYLLPAFPKEWDVSFRLHPDKNTVITAAYKKGMLGKVEVIPESARERIIYSKCCP